MSSSRTNSCQSKLFEKKDENFFRNISEAHSFECVLFQKNNSKEGQTKIWFMRLYENFFVLSKVHIN